MEFLINIFDRRIALCDMDFIHSLRCYKDSELGFYTTGKRDSCDFRYIWTSINQSSNELLIYPNPVEDKLKIQIGNNDKVNYEIFNLNGLILKRGNEKALDLSGFQNGIYFIRLTINNIQVKTIKIIKQLP